MQVNPRSDMYVRTRPTAPVDYGHPRPGYPQMQPPRPSPPQADDVGVYEAGGIYGAARRPDVMVPIPSGRGRGARSANHGSWDAVPQQHVRYGWEADPPTPPDYEDQVAWESEDRFS